MGHKIATCNYCGTRAALVFDQGRHELTCSSCGAPLHDMKAMPQAPAKQAPAKAVKSAPAERPANPRRRKVTVDWDEERRFALGERAMRKPQKPRKRRKPFARKVLEELWDVVEDIFD